MFSEPLAGLGPIHLGRKVIQPKPRVVREFHVEAAPLLKHPVLTFGPEQIALIGAAFGEVVRRQRYTCYACAVMPDHAHLVIRKHRDTAEQMLEFLQDESRMALLASGFCDPDHPVWTRSGWRGFLEAPWEVRTRIGYTKRNQGRDRRRCQ